MKIKKIIIENFKGCKSKSFDFNGNKVVLSGCNASGKTTIMDAFNWVLFNKDSLGSEKFSIRPLDSNGNPIDNIEIKVSLVLEIDGEEREFTKTQKQKWVKKRGIATAELQGNENLYEVDGFPKSEKDFKSAISQIVDENIFKMMSNPMYFPNLKWKEQRDILMKFVDDISDYELSGMNPNFALIRADLKKADNIDDIVAKYRKALLEWKKVQAELPIRIDEAAKSKIDIDVAELELLKKAIIDEISDNNDKQVHYTLVYDELEQLKTSLMKMCESANSEIVDKRNQLSMLIGNKEALLKIKYVMRTDTLNNVKAYKKACEDIEKNISLLKERYSNIDRQSDEDIDIYCPTCGQMFPEDKQELVKANSKNARALELSRIEDNIKDNETSLEAKRGRLEKTRAILSELDETIHTLENEIKELKENLDRIAVVDVSETDEYKALNAKIKAKEEELALIPIKEYLAQYKGAQERLKDVERKIALFDKNIEIDERISELQAEQREVAQKVANQEQMLYILEEFIRFKMDRFSSDINSKFDGLNFKLFENQINGGLKETCELTVNGVPYNSLNTGHRIVAGLQIIKALQKLYSMDMPIFIDNAEAVNDFNMPNLDCQIILLKVSENKELNVEVSR